MTVRPEGRRAHRQAGLSTRALVLGVVASILLLAAAFLIPDGADAIVIWPCLIVFYAIFWDAIKRPVYIHPNIPTYISIEVLFLIFYYILCYMPYQLAVFGAFDLYNSVFRIEYVWKSNQAVVISTLALVPFYMGTQWRRVTQAVQSVGQPVERSYRLMPHIVSVALSGFILLYHLSGWRRAGEGRYTGTTTGGVLAEGVGALIMMFCMIAIALPMVRLAQRKPIPVAMWPGLVLALYWSMRLLSFGDRNSFLLLAIVGVGGLLTYRFRTSRLMIVGLLVLSLQVYNAVEVLRMIDGASFSDVLAASAQEEDLERNSFNYTTVIIRASLDAVPHRVPFGMGVYQLVGFTGIVPFLAGALFSRTLEYQSTGSVLTHVMLGDNPNWGVGTSIATDIYIDFGIVGVPIVMFLVGRFAGAIRNAAVANPFSTRATVFYLFTLALFAELPRYSLAFPVRIMVWTALLFWLYGLMFRPAPSPQQSLRPTGRAM